MVKINKTIKRYKPKSILVTGGSGFVGSILVPELLRQSYSVKLLLRKSYPKMHLKCKKFIIDDYKTSNYKKIFQKTDVVIHLAGRAHVMSNKGDSLFEYRKVNLDMTRTIARHAALSGVKRFIFISSIKVNGEFTSSSSKFLPDDKPNPKDAYGISKMEAEFALIQLGKETGMEIVIIRPPLIYGPGVKANFLSLMKLLYINLPIPLGNIKNKRSLVFVGNLVNLISKLIDHPKAANQIFLISDNCDVSTSTLLRSISLLLGKNVKLFSVPNFVLNAFFFLIGKKDLSQRLLASLTIDMTKTKKLLGWSPPYSFEEGIKSTAQDFLRNIKRRKFIDII